MTLSNSFAKLISGTSVAMLAASAAVFIFFRISFSSLSVSLSLKFVSPFGPLSEIKSMTPFASLSPMLLSSKPFANLLVVIVASFCSAALSPDFAMYCSVNQIVPAAPANGLETTPCMMACRSLSVRVSSLNDVPSSLIRAEICVFCSVGISICETISLSAGVTMFAAIPRIF